MNRFENGFSYKIRNGMAPNYLSDIFTQAVNSITPYTDFRNGNNYLSYNVRLALTNKSVPRPFFC